MPLGHVEFEALDVDHGAAATGAELEGRAGLEADAAGGGDFLGGFAGGDCVLAGGVVGRDGEVEAVGTSILGGCFFIGLHFDFIY